ncbi:MAG: MFS transporter [Planctomycetota bacterium]
MRTPNPFSGLPNARTVWAWGMYDLANQSFTLLVNTLLFAVFFKEVIVGEPRRGDALWAVAFSSSMLLVVVLSPILGALADARGIRKQILFISGYACAALTVALALTGADAIWLAMLLYIPANFCYQIGENFLASFLPSVSTQRNIGRVSATGWAMGYIGALLLLVIVAVTMQTFGLGDPADWSPFFVMAGLWFILNMTPSLVMLREPPTERPVHNTGTIVGEAFARLKHTLDSAGDFRQLVRFLIAFLIFGMGVQVIVAFAAIIAKDFGFNTTKLVLYVLQITVTAGAAAIATALFQDRIGARATVLGYLGVWMVSAAGLLTISLTPGVGEWAFWVVGNGIGIGLGGIGTASRSMVGRFTPAHKTAEFFGLWGMVFKLAGAIGPLSFGQLKAWIGMSASLLLLFAFFAVGFVLTRSVDELAGIRAARRAERALRAG